MSRKMVGWIALAVFVVGGLFYGLNAALGSEPAPAGAKKASHTSAPTSDGKPNTLRDASSIAKQLIDAVKDRGNGANSAGSPVSFLRNLTPDHAGNN